MFFFLSRYFSNHQEKRGRYLEVEDQVAVQMLAAWVAEAKRKKKKSFLKEANELWARKKTGDVKIDEDFPLAPAPEVKKPKLPSWMKTATFTSAHLEEEPTPKMSKLYSKVSRMGVSSPLAYLSTEAEELVEVSRRENVFRYCRKIVEGPKVSPLVAEELLAKPSSGDSQNERYCIAYCDNRSLTSTEIRPRTSRKGKKSKTSHCSSRNKKRSATSGAP